MTAITATPLTFSWPVGDDEQRSRPWPIGDWFIGQGFAQQYPAVTGRKDWHPGVDLNRPGYQDSNAPVYNVADGIIQFAGTIPGWKKQIVVIKHTLENGRSIWSRYAHIDAIPLTRGAPIKRGELIGHIADYPPEKKRAGDHLDFSLAWRDLGREPGDWPGTNLQRLNTDYTDPIKFTQERLP